jgi:hypothetical protein
MNAAFKPILDAVGLMQGFPSPWFVSGGWAIDLFLGEVTRNHADIEIGIYRRDQQALWHQLPDCSFEKALPSDGRGTWVRWETGEELVLPIHQIRAKRSDVGLPEIEFLLNERTEANWLTRRHPGMMRSVSDVMTVSSLGIPILVPEIQLLFKAKQTRQKDRADFKLILPRLSQTQRKWLALALREYYPAHEWIDAIERDQAT